MNLMKLLTLNANHVSSVIKELAATKGVAVSTATRCLADLIRKGISNARALDAITC